MSFEQIRYEIADHVLTITLDRPDRLNAFTPTMGRELIEAFDRADADDDVRAIIVTGEGRGFCAGADLSGGGDTSIGATARRRTRSRATAAGRSPCASSTRPKPVIAAINGPAVGVGITMTLPMDIRLAAEGAKIGFVFARRGHRAGGRSSWFLPRDRGHQPGDGVGRDRPRLHGRGGAGRRASCAAFTRRRAAGRRPRAGRARSPGTGAGVGGAGPPADVDGCSAPRTRWTPIGRTPARCSRGTIRRRARGGHVVPREARPRVHRRGERRTARPLPAEGNAGVLLIAPRLARPHSQGLSHGGVVLTR